jgi:high-affinity nickel permease
VLGLWASKLKLGGKPWHALSALNRNIATLGYIIIAVFVFSWLIFMTVYRLKRHDKIELNA